MRNILVALVAACMLLSACSSPAVSKAIGTGTDGDSPIVVRMSESAVTVENHAGRPLLNVRITITAEGAKSFALVVPTIDPGATMGRRSIRRRSNRHRWRSPRETHWQRRTK